MILILALVCAFFFTTHPASSRFAADTILLVKSFHQSIQRLSGSVRNDFLTLVHNLVHTHVNIRSLGSQLVALAQLRASPHKH